MSSPYPRDSALLARGPPKLIVLCGPSHSGKTTFAQSPGDGFRIIGVEDLFLVGVAVAHQQDAKTEVSTLQCVKSGRDPSTKCRNLQRSSAAISSMVTILPSLAER